MARRTATPPYVEVCVEVGGGGVPRVLTYGQPRSLPPVQVGDYVLVPLRNRQVTGHVVGLTDHSPAAHTKPVVDRLSPQPLFTPRQLELARWVSRYYHCPLVDAVRLLIPPGLRQRPVSRFRVCDAEAARQFLADAPERAVVQRAIMEALLVLQDGATAAEIARQSDRPAGSVRSSLSVLCERGLVVEEQSLTQGPRGERQIRLVELAESCPRDSESLLAQTRRAPKQRAVVEHLMTESDPVPVTSVLEATGASSDAVRRLADKGWVVLSSVGAGRRRDETVRTADAAGLPLTAEQSEALDLILESLRQSKPKPLVLHGVTASGKTEVYLRAIEHVVQQGQQVIVLVPEIALTAQIMGLFYLRFGDRVAILHSRLSAGERSEEHERIRSGQVDVVVGARSAIFAPCVDVGLIIVDEEHEQSYKQDKSPRYHAREVAQRRAAIEGALLVLGSATPSVETYFRAQRGAYQMVRMARRVHDRPLPELLVVDMRREGRPSRGEARVLSGTLSAKIQERMERGEQIILFLNRRGFSPVEMCRDCGFVTPCDHCDVALTFHRTQGLLRCHHCNMHRPAHDTCPECGGIALEYRGIGTQRLESALREQFPDLSLLRMDRDTTSQRGAHAALLREFAAGRAQALLGTQMIAKGLDFPGVTLVGVVAADLALNLPDFRAAERCFQLLMQVSGRAGRGDQPGQVVVQTYQPRHYSLTAARHHDYLEFFAREIALRQDPAYPPMTHLVNVTAMGPDDAEVRAALDLARQKLVALRQAETTQIIGPAPCALSRVKDQYRHHFLIRDPNRPRLQRLLAAWLDPMESSLRRRITVDVDPVSML